MLYISENNITTNSPRIWLDAQHWSSIKLCGNISKTWVEDLGVCAKWRFRHKKSDVAKMAIFRFFQNGDHRRLAFLFEKFNSREGQEVHLLHCVKFSGDRSNGFSGMVIFRFFFSRWRPLPCCIF